MPPNERMSKRTSSPLRLCLMLAKCGPAGLWAPSAIASAELAICDINRAGGLFGRELEVFTTDCGTSAGMAMSNAIASVEVDGADAMIGMFPSYARAEVAQAIGGKLPFIYTPQFEGGEWRRDVITTGETTHELLDVAVSWLARKRRARRFFLCGANYRWPRESFAVARRVIASIGGEVVGEAFQRLGDQDYDLLLQSIGDSRADVVIPMFLGLDAVAFNRAFARAGMAERMVRCAPGLDETILYGLSPDDTENLYSASGYFSSQRSANNGSYLERYHMKFGDHPPPANAYGESVYEGIYSLVALAQATGSLDPGSIRSMLGRVVPRRSARNGSELRPVGSRQSVMIAAIDGYDMRIMSEYSGK